ncbi:MAG: ATP-dependent DNA helicase RecG [Candidatus Dormibacteria bacterium]
MPSSGPAERLRVLPGPALDDPVGRLSGVGPQHRAMLGRLGIQTVRDLLLHLPRRYDDFSVVAPLARLTFGQVQTARVRLDSVRQTRTRYKKMDLIEARVSDGTGQAGAVWFRQDHLIRMLRPGDQLLLSGPVEAGRDGRPSFRNPRWERLRRDGSGPADVAPVYPETRGLSSRWLRDHIRPLLPLASQLPDPLPPEVRDRQGLMGLEEAVATAHFPRSPRLGEEALWRLRFQQVFVHQAVGLLERQRLKREPGVRIPFDESAARAFVASLPFPLTGAQRRAAWDILRDMDRVEPMNRMLEGDVGSGKTLVAAFCACMAARAGFQTVLMAPTEILARQHRRTMADLLEPHGLLVELATGRATARDRRRFRESMAQGMSQVAVGTHALLTEEVTFANLGLAIVDEQHRFGVEQRRVLREKAGHSPDFLSMTATPIPRSLWLTLYGDLDISVLDELPPGRLPVETRVAGPGRHQESFELVRQHVGRGRQAFVICPLIDESERLQARAATQELERLRAGDLAGLRLALLHGRMKPAEKDQVMAAFASGELDVLVSTSVVEVGVDIPNATVMVVENAERFGLAQLHQLRGRVGRGEHGAVCVLLTDDAEATERLELVANTSDGFRLAEMDMHIRGTGDQFGRAQHGFSGDAETLLDLELLERARKEVRLVLEQDPELERHPLTRAAVESQRLAYAPD